MRTKYLKAATTLLMILIFTTIPAQTEHKALYEKAKYTMETKGDLKSAINHFEEIINNYPSEKEYGAKSQFYIGLCYQKLGLAEAKKAFKKVINNYPAQIEIVSLARGKLSTLNSGSGNIADNSFRIRQIHDNNPVLGLYGTVSHNGRYLSDVNWAHGNLAIFDYKTKEYRDLTKTAHWGVPSHFCDWSIFSPNDKQIAYYWIEGDDHTLRIIGIDEMKPRILCKGNKRLPPPWPLHWSADGKYIIARTTENPEESFKDHSKSKHQIVLVSVKDGSIRVIKKLGDLHCSKKEEDNIKRIGADLSKNGSNLIYHKHQKKDSKKMDIYMMGINGEYDVPIIQHPANDYNPFWMPDGKHILFMSDRLGDPGIWVQKLNGRKAIGEPVLIHTLSKSIHFEGISGDGSFYYASTHEFLDVYTVEFDKKTGFIIGTPELLGKEYEGRNISPFFSDDNKQFAFITDPIRLNARSFKDGILIINNLETGNEQKINLEEKVDSYEFNSFHWTKDGKGIMFIGLVNDQYGIHLVNIDSGKISPYLKYNSEDHIKEYLVSPDWKFIYLLKRTGKNVYHLVLRDLQSGSEKELYSQESDQNVLGPMALSADGKQLVLRDGRNIKDGKQIELLVRIPTSGGNTEILMEKVFNDTQGIWRPPGLTWTLDGKYLIFGRLYKYPDNRIVMYRFSIDEKKVKEMGLTMDRVANVSVHPDGNKLVFHASRPECGYYKIENIMAKVNNSK